MWSVFPNKCQYLQYVVVVGKILVVHRLLIEMTVTANNSLSQNYTDPDYQLNTNMYGTVPVHSGRFNLN